MARKLTPAQHRARALVAGLGLELGAGLDLPAVIEALERHLIDQALRRVGNNRTAAATLLGMKRTTLMAWLKKRHLLRRYPLATADDWRSVWEKAKNNHG